jgi:hypothetical protein
MNPSEGLPDPYRKQELTLDDQRSAIPWVSNAGRPLDDPFAVAQRSTGSGFNTSNYDLGRHGAEVTTAPATATPPTRPVGWYRNASNPNDVRYWDGTRWLDRQPDHVNGTGYGPDGSASTPPVSSPPESTPPVSSPPLSTSPATTPPASIETGDWHPDPLGRYKLRWISAGVATQFVSDEDGRVSFDEPTPTPTQHVAPGPTQETAALAVAQQPADSPREPDPAPYLNGADPVASAAVVNPAPAEWYPDPANPARLRYWDGSGWTGHVLDQTPSP